MFNKVLFIIRSIIIFKVLEFGSLRQGALKGSIAHFRNGLLAEAQYPIILFGKIPIISYNCIFDT